MFQRPTLTDKKLLLPWNFHFRHFPNFFVSFHFETQTLREREREREIFKKKIQHFKYNIIFKRYGKQNERRFDLLSERREDLDRYEIGGSADTSGGLSERADEMERNQVGMWRGRLWCVCSDGDVFGEFRRIHSYGKRERLSQASGGTVTG